MGIAGSNFVGPFGNYFWLIHYNLVSIGLCYAFIRDALNDLNGDAYYYRYYPKDYISPRKWMSKLFRIRKNKILIWAFIQLYFAIGALLLGPALSIILYFSEGDFNYALKLAGIEYLYCVIYIIIRFIHYLKSEIAKKSYIKEHPKRK